MKLWDKYKEFRDYNLRAVQTLEELLLQAKIFEGTVTKEQALSIPSVSACIDIITGIVGSLDVKLYKELDGKTEEVKDNRTFILNKNTGDTLNPNDFKKAMITDYILEGNSYALINKVNGAIKSLNYVDCISVNIIKQVEPIFKDYDISIVGQKYLPFQFIKILKNSKDGCTGTGIISQNNNALSVAYQTMEFEKILLKTGGNKRGFLKAKSKLNKEGLDALRNAWNNLYNNNTSNMMILNEGVDFVEAQSTSVEMQLNETKKTNSSEICKIIGVPYGLLEGNVTEQEFNIFIKMSILTILKAFESALNSVLLTEKEKQTFYFQFDTTDLLKGSTKERYEAYKLAKETGFISLNEIRNKENMEDIVGLDVIPLSLADVIFDIKTGKYFVPNMGVTTDLKTPLKVTDPNVTTEEPIK